MVFEFDRLDTLTLYQFTIYREVGQDSYVPHLYQTGDVQMLQSNY
jgi:hypothetical protein